MATIPTRTWYLVKKSGRQICVKVEHFVSNGYAAKRDMMALYGLSASDIVTSSGALKNPWPTLSCNIFDGTNSH